MRRRWKWTIGLAIGAVIIALLLWALPVALRIGAVHWLNAQGFKAQIADIDLNLFTGRLAVTGAHATKPGGNGFKVDKLVVNLRYRPLFSRDIYLSNLAIVNGQIDVQRDGHGNLTVAGFPVNTPAAPEQPQTDSSPWGFGLDRAAIGGLAIHYRAPGYDRTVNLTSSTARDVATWQPHQAIPVDAAIAMGKARLALTGRLWPFGERITGKLHLKIDRFGLDQVAPLLKSTGIDKLAGQLDADLHLTLDYNADRGLAANIDGSTGLTGTRLTMPGLNIQQDNIHWQGKIKASLDQPLAVTADGALSLNNSTLSMPGLLDLAQGQLNWRGKLTTTLAKAGAAATAHGKLTTGDTDISLPAEGLAVQQKALHWNGQADYGPGKPAIVHADGSLRSTGSNVNLGSLKMALAAQHLNWNGKVALDPAAAGMPKNAALPLKVAGQLDGGGIAVTDNARTRQLAKVADFSVSGIDIRGLDNIRGAKLQADGLSALQRAADAPRHQEHPDIVTLKQLTATRIALTNQSRLALDKVSATGLDGLIYRGRKGTWEIEQWFAGPTQADNKTAAAPAPSTPPAAAADTGPGLQIALQHGRIGGGRLAIDDRGVSPAFATQLSNLDIAVADLDAAHPTRGSALDVSSTIGRYGSLKANGSIKPFLEPPSADITGKINAVNLGPISGYAAAAIDRRIDRGTFSANLKFKLDRGNIDAQTQLVLSKLRIGGVQGANGTVKSKLGLPLNKILGLLRDRDGKIRLNLPVGGNLESPNFSVMSIVRKALLKSLQAAVLVIYAPLGLLKKAGHGLLNLGNALHFQPILFDPGKAQLDSGDKSFLDKTAKVLGKRPQSQLIVCGHAVPADRGALGLPSPTVAAGQTPPSAQTLANASDRLLQLAGTRATAVGDYLIAQGVAQDRLVLCNPALGEPANAKPRTTTSF